MTARNVFGRRTALGWIVLLCCAWLGGAWPDSVRAQAEDPLERTRPRGVGPTTAAISTEAQAEKLRQGEVSRGPGWYVSFTKLGLTLAFFWIWAISAQWVGEDARKYGHNVHKWNGLMVGLGAAGLIAILAIPIFWAGWPLAIVAATVPFVMYVRLRNPPLPDYEQVFTKAHLRYVASKALRPLGIKIQAEAPKKEDLDPIKYKPQGAANPQDNQVNLLTAKQSPMYDKSMAVLRAGFDKKAQLMLMDLTQAAGAVIRYQVDGLWEQGDTLDLPSGMALAAVYKRVAGLNAEDFRAKLTGTFGAQIGRDTFPVQILSQGVPQGARVLLTLDDGGKKLESLEQLGFSDENVKRVKELLKAKQGLVLVSAMPAGGLSTTYNAVVRAADRYVKNWVAIEDSAAPEKKVDNVEPHFFDSTKGESPCTILPKLIRLYPDCYACRHLPDPTTVKALLSKDVGGEDHVVVASLRSREAAEAPLRVLMLQDQAGGRVAPAELAPHLLGVVTVRLVRRLCPDCKEAYEPGEQALAQMRLDPKQVQKLYRVPVPKPNEKPKPVCTTCRGRGYSGRAAMAEVLVMNDALRQILATSPKLDLLRAEARKAGMRLIQEDGIRLIGLGVTSIEEVQRVMQEGKSG